MFLLYFLPVFLILYYILWKKLKNGWILVASIAFYGWGAPVFVFYVAVSVLVDFLILRKMDSTGQATRKAFFWISVAMNLGLLLYFKYMNFFVDQFNEILGWFGGKPVHWTAIALPVGISFITFQKLACTFDVYRKTVSPFRKIQDYALYIFMFPQLLSGPIVRPGQIAAQITDRAQQETVDDRLTGFIRFMIGLAKKVLIADTLAQTVTQIFSLNSFQLSSGLAWAGAIAYTFRIYFDFSGYTDMAIGLARMIGFRLPENFKFPYISVGITEFWKRWHITLSTWLRDYIFLPLVYSVSRKMPREKYFGLKADLVIYLIGTLITFFICGLWHGAAWPFILWGIYQGLFLILDRLFLLKIYKRITRIPGMIITFLITVIGWVMFRSPNMDFFYFFVRRMFTFRTAHSDVWLDAKFWTVLAIAAVFSFWGISKKVEKWVERLYDKPGSGLLIGFSILAVLLFILSEATITSSGFRPFIYFRF